MCSPLHCDYASLSIKKWSLFLKPLESELVCDLALTYTMWWWCCAYSRSSELSQGGSWNLATSMSGSVKAYIS